MSEVVRRIVDVEREADAIIEAAHRKAADREREALSEIDAFRAGALKDLASRIDSYEAQAMARQADLLLGARRELEEELLRLEAIPEERIASLAKKVVERLEGT